MKNTDYAEVIGPREIRLVRLLPGPIERVWTYLTDPEKRGTWLASGPMELRVDGPVDLHFLHANLSAEKAVPPQFKAIENGHTMQGRITQCEPPRRLAYTWSEAPDDHSEVSFDLTPQGKNVQLVLVHRRLRNLEELKGVAGGWHTHLDVLLARLAGVEPPLFWTTFLRVQAVYETHITGP